MAASIGIKCISSKLSRHLSQIIKVNSFENSVVISRVHGVRFCSNFRSKSAITDRQEETENVNEIEQKETPKWMLTRQAFARRYAKEGRASEVDPSIMWPTRSELENIIKDEEEWCPSLQQMQLEIAEEQRAKELKIRKRNNLIAANMAKMPKMEAEYRKKMAEKQAILEEQMAKRNRLLEEAKDKLGYAIDPRSSRFQRMVQEIEKDEKKKKKELKKKGIVLQ